MINIISILLLGLTMNLNSDEGMWTLDNLPLPYLKEKYRFTPAVSFLKNTQLSSVRFNDGGSGSLYFFSGSSETFAGGGGGGGYVGSAGAGGYGGGGAGGTGTNERGFNAASGSYGAGGGGSSAGGPRGGGDGSSGIVIIKYQYQ